MTSQPNSRPSVVADCTIQNMAPVNNDSAAK